jgi:hypothetical protein
MDEERELSHFSILAHGIQITAATARISEMQALLVLASELDQKALAWPIESATYRRKPHRVDIRTRGGGSGLRQEDWNAIISVVNEVFPGGFYLDVVHHGGLI